MGSAGLDLAVLSDFDGTLSAIVAHPPDATAVPGARDALGWLVASGAMVGVISGRPVTFLQEAVGLDHVVYRGVHGLERAVGSGVPEPIEELRPLAADLSDVRASMRDAADRIDGVVFEDKRVAFSLHYRNASSPDAAAKMCRKAAEAATSGRPFRLVPGRMVVEVLPDIAMDKGVAVEQEAVRCGARSVVFAGDDTGDLAAFAALDRLGARGIHTVKVAVRSDESPPELVEQADVVLDGPLRTPAWLGALV